MALIEQFAKFIKPILENGTILSVRRNHGLEHATIHMLNRQNLTLSGRSSAGGFVLYGDVSTEKVERAVQDALTRFRRGEAQWAVHPNCGTNLVTTGVLTTSIAALGFTGTSRKRAWDRFPVVMVFMMIASLYSLPIGMSLQKYITTTGQMGDLDVVSIKRREVTLPFGKKSVVHQVKTQS
ncbi:hypothetical protein G4Y79_22875 [Phototrophicus methaneseepsis]|uniref:Uncharacterized protein n=1 Tax=Phototrophicus methaneseepsis TaxID=2710758 RepID=A0A7S8E8T3_9CHLR|nr:DUF6391 domain-containing protein [Phototrophicus methaneseepsis]QPC82495.1 hypothetical protein G4Y79_22875 [Phototrophicus methaneseepsis]